MQLVAPKVGEHLGLRLDDRHRAHRLFAASRPSGAFGAACARRALNDAAALALLGLSHAALRCGDADACRRPWPRPANLLIAALTIEILQLSFTETAIL